jgi:hypothetical protein
MSDPFAGYDDWLQKGNPDEEPEPKFCEACDAVMEYEDDVDVDEETGKAYVCFGGWSCPNCD